MANLRAIRRLQEQWWARTNERPLAHIFYPAPDDRDAPPVPSDSLIVKSPDMGTAFLPGLAGAEYHDDGTTTWAEPCAARAADLRIPPFDPQHPLWQECLRRFAPILANWSWESYLPAPTIMAGPMETLSGLLGPETLSLELFDDPEAVRAAALDAARLFLEVYEAQWALLRGAGFTGGVVDWMKTWLPGRGFCYSEDYSALCSARQFRRFFLEPNTRITTRLDTPYLHIHSAAWRSIPAILELPNLKAIELSNDPNGPGLDDYIATVQRIQQAGLSVQASNWEHPLTRDEIRTLLDSLDPHGLKITLQASSAAEARELYALVKRY